MYKLTCWIIFFAVALTSCSGSDTIIKKNWDPKTRTMAILDLTSDESEYIDAGAQLMAELENSMLDTIFVLDQEAPVFKLKFKVTDFKEGSRLSRMATLGIGDSGRAELKVKVALFQGKTMLGAWEVNTWVNGGMAGGSEETLFSKAAEEIIAHLKSSY